MEEINQQLASQVSANSPQIAQNELISQGNSQNPNQNAQIQQINNQSIMNNRRRSDFQNNQSHSRSSNNSDSNNNTFVSGNNNSIIANQNSFMQRSGMKQRIDLTPAQIDISSSRDHPRQHYYQSTENHQYHTINNQNDRDDRPLRLPDRSENANLSDQQIFRNQPRQTDEELKQPSDFQLNLGQQQAVQNQSVVQELSEEEYEDEKQEYQRYQMKQAMEFNGFRDEMSEDSSFIMEDSEQYKNQYYYLNRTDRDEFEEKMQNSDPIKQSDLIINLRTIFENFRQKKEFQNGKIKIPFASNYGQFMENTFQLFNTQNDSEIDKSIEILQQFYEFMIVLEKIFYPEIYVIYFNFKRENKLIFDRTMHIMVMNRITRVVCMLIRGEEDQPEKEEIHRKLVTQLMRVSIILNCLYGQIKYLLYDRNVSPADEVPELIRKIIRRQYLDFNPVNMAEQSFEKHYERVGIKCSLMQELYNISYLFEDFGYNLKDLKFINEVTAALIQMIYALIRHHGNYSNITYLALSLVENCILKGFKNFANNLLDNPPENTQKFMYEVDIKISAHKILEIQNLVKKIGVTDGYLQENLNHYREKVKNYQFHEDGKIQKERQQKHKIMLDYQHRISICIQDIVSILDPKGEVQVIDYEQLRHQEYLEKDTVVSQALTHNQFLDKLENDQNFQEQMKNQMLDTSMRLNEDKDKLSSETEIRSKLNELSNFFNIDKKSVGEQMEVFYEYVIELYNRDFENKCLIDRRELVGYMHRFLIGSVRKVRAFSMSLRLVTMIEKFFEFLKDNKYESIGKLVKIRTAFGHCWEHLTKKFESDPNLQASQEFNDAYFTFDLTYKSLQKMVFHYRGERLSTMLNDKQERTEMQNQAKRYMQNPLYRKSVSQLIKSVTHDYLMRNQENIKKFQGYLEDQLIQVFGLDKDKLKSNLYGLTGCGLQFRDSSIKIMIRMNQVVKTTAPLISLAKQALERKEYPLLVPTSPWKLQICYVHEDRYLYLQLVENDVSPEYNGLVFKVKFEHMEVRREARLASLLKRYFDFDSGRLRKVAVVWILFLKLNCLTGKKYGYPSSMAYLLMLINQGQMFYILPNLQRAVTEEEKIKVEEYTQLEKMTESERKFINNLLCERTLNQRGDNAKNLDIFEQQKQLQHIKVSYFMRQNFNLMQDELRAQRHLLNIGKMDIDRLLIQFLKNMAGKLPQRNTKFSIYSGIFKKQRLRRRQLLSIQDPFIKQINHGSILKNRRKFNKLIIKIKEFLRFLCKGSMAEYLLLIMQEIKSYQEQIIIKEEQRKLQDLEFNSEDDDEDRDFYDDEDDDENQQNTQQNQQLKHEVNQQRNQENKTDSEDHSQAEQNKS
eukprot:403333015